MPKILNRIRPKKPKLCARQWFVAAIHATGPFAVLSPKPGCQRVLVTLGEEIEEKVVPEPHVVLRANRGDHLILFGPTIEETQDSRVVRVERDGFFEKLHVELGYGGPLASTTTQVRVLRGRKYKQPKQLRLRAA